MVSSRAVLAALVSFGFAGLALAGDTAADAQLRAAIGKIETMVGDKAARFSASQTLAELGQLAAQAKANPAELRRIHMMSGVVEHKRWQGAVTAQMHDVEPMLAGQTRDAFAKAFAIAVPANADPEREARDHYMMGEVAEALHDMALSAKHYGLAVTWAEKASGLSQDHKLAMRVQYGFALHETGLIKEALAVNAAALKDGEARYGADSYELRAVLTNIAQNLHKLGRGAEAEPYLVRCRKLANANGDVAKEQDMLFQLGVLAFELGRPADARAFMNERIALLSAHNEPELLASAREDLAILEEKLK